MRLGQLARHLNTTTTKIVNYLAENHISVKDHPNVKLHEGIEQQVILAFSDATEVPPVEPTVLAIENDNTDNDLVNRSSEAPKQSEPGEAPPIRNAADEVQNQEEPEVEVIKAPKITLQGLKVVGKIDLPEPKPKPSVSEDPEAAKPKTTRRSEKRRQKRELSEEEKEKRKQKSKKARQKREQIEQQRKLEQEKHQLKKLKKQHYLKKLNKPVMAVEKAKSKADIKRAREEAEKPPTTILGRFWRWLNT